MNKNNKHDDEQEELLKQLEGLTEEELNEKLEEELLKLKDALEGSRGDVLNNSISVMLSNYFMIFTASTMPIVGTLLYGWKGFGIFTLLGFIFHVIQHFTL